MNNIHWRNCYSSFTMEPTEISFPIDTILGKKQMEKESSFQACMKIEYQHNNIYPVFGNFLFPPNHCRPRSQKNKTRTTFTSEQIFRLEEIFRERVRNVFKVNKYEFIFIFISLSSLL